MDCGPPLQGGFGECEDSERVRTQASAQKLYLTSDAIVYERAAHSARVMRNYVAYDQYGHRYPAAAVAPTAFPAMKLSIPLGRAEVELLPRKQVVKTSPGYDEMAKDCCDYTPVGDVIAVKVGDGIKMTVMIVECGKGSNAPEFVAACNRAAKSAPAESPELNAAFSNFLLERLKKMGTMTGCAAPANESMRREGPWPQSAGGRSEPFVKFIGPLPPNARIDFKKGGSWSASTTHIAALGDVHVDKNRQIWHPHGSPVVDQMNAGDRLVSFCGVRLEGKLMGEEGERFAQQANANSQMLASQGQPLYAEVVSDMPYFMPNHLVSATVPSGAQIAELGLEPTDGKPPKIGAALTPLAQSLGLQPTDVVIQAVINGAAWDTTRMSAPELLNAASGASGAVPITVLQVTRVASLSHPATWPMSGGPS